MIFVDSNTPMYLGGAAHPHKAEAPVIMERHAIQSVLTFDRDFDRWPGIRRIHGI